MSLAAPVMVRRPSMDTSCAVPAPPGRRVSVALALALALALGAGGAAAQTCDSARTVTAATPLSTFSSNTDLTRTFANVRIETTGGLNAFAVHAYRDGNGDVDLDVKDFTLSTTGNSSGAVLVSRIFRPARNTGNIDVNVQCGSIATSGTGSYGVEATNFDEGDIAVVVKKVDITTSGDNARGLHFNRAQRPGEAYAAQGVKDGDVTVEVGDSTIATSGANAHAVWISQDRAVTGGGAGGIDADLTNVAISTSGAGAIGVHVFHRHTTGAVALDVTGGSVSTSGAGGHAVVVDRADAGNAAITLAGVAIAAEGSGADGVRALHGGSGTVALTIGAGAAVRGGRHGVHAGGAVLVAGSDDLRGRTVTVDGEVMGGTGAGVHMARGGTVVIGGNGRVGASSGTAILADGGGDLVVVLADPGGSGEAAPRIDGRIEVTGGGAPRVLHQRAGGAGTVELRAGGPGAPSGAWDVSVKQDGSGLRVVREFGPRARVYEALPSVLLGMNSLARFRERMAAPRTEDGAWARVEASRGDWSAESSTTGGLEYNHRRHGLRAGWDVPAGEEGLFGFSVHHRRGSADVLRGGEIDLSGAGAGVSGAWMRDGFYVDAQGELTWYEADFRSSSRGTLKEDVSGRGRALGLEAGRRMPLAGGAVLTPRAGVEHSRVTLDGFTDAVGARVSMEEARSLKGRVGLVVEAPPDDSPHRLSGSLDVEHEFEDDAKVRMTGADLAPEAKATWVRLGLDGSRAFGDDGRYTLSGGLDYATNGDSQEFAGAVSVGMRF